MVAEKEKKGFDAKMLWLDQPDNMPLSIEVKDFARFVIRVFNLRAENLDVSEYRKIVNDGKLLEKLAASVSDYDRPTLDYYSSIDNSSLQFYIDHSKLCLTGRYEVFCKI